MAAMDHAAVLVACRGLPGATEGYPFGEGALVLKVGGKMFAIVSLVDEGTISPDELREMVEHSHELVVGKLPREERSPGVVYNHLLLATRMVRKFPARKMRPRQALEEIRRIGLSRTRRQRTWLGSRVAVR